MNTFHIQYKVVNTTPFSRNFQVDDLKICH